MKTAAFYTLIAMNLALGAGFISRMTRPNTANAQVRGGVGDYLMIPGQIVGGVNEVVYVVDQTSHQLAAMAYDDSSHTIVTFNPRNMDRDFDARPGRR